MLKQKVSKAAPWCKQLDARLPPLGIRVHVSVTPCGFHDGRNGVWVGFSRGFSRFPLPQILFHHFSTLISFIFINLCDDASGMACFNIGASSHFIPEPFLCRIRDEEFH